jgi:hypothetical protein
MMASACPGWRTRAGLAAIALLAVGCGNGDDDNPVAPEAAALIVDRALDADRTADFLRVIFLPASVEATTLGAPSAVRVFVASSTYFIPALALAEVADFLGVPDAAELDLIGLRCQPDQPNALDVRLAIWPQVFAIIQGDLGGGFSCPPPPGAPPENAVYCLAVAYTDDAGTVVTRPLATALEFGAELLENPDSAAIVRRRYGIFPAFTGLGLTVRGSAAGPRLTAAEALHATVSPEYLVRNVTLAEGACRCIRVAPYAGRSMDPFDPELIRRHGGLGVCRSVPKLRFAG